MVSYELISRESAIFAELYGEKIEFIVNRIFYECAVSRFLTPCVLRPVRDRFVPKIDDFEATSDTS